MAVEAPTTDLISRAREALDSLEREGPGSGARATELLRILREAVTRIETAGVERPAWRALIHRVLQAAMHRSVREAFERTPFAAEWTDLLVRAVIVADFTIGPLFLARARDMGDRTLFLLAPQRPEGRLSWAEVSRRVHEIARALLELRERGEVGPDRPVAMLTQNSPEGALLDLACLILGVRNVPVPANSPPAQIAWIVRHCGAQVLFYGDERLAREARDGLEGDLPARQHWIDPNRPPADGVASFGEFLYLGEDREDEEVRLAALAVKSADVATVMYTSGTTGDPKGVPFTQANLVTKRFARAAAWPDLGEGDVFLCYLPLYHTFGRWLEMLGCVFWGAVYAFVEDVSAESLLHSFQRVRPTTFISVPKKWIQVAESVAPLEDDGDEADTADLARRLTEATGGRLKRGLSAAGYLPPTVFRRFHEAGIELHSGFGMTEATGGITMTPPGDYQPDSIGVALPAIELKIADDGELLIRGPYVTPPADSEPPREDGWFATGDIVTGSVDGHLRIVDRKKEIFKNVQGETISPRRVERLFADFDLVERVLLVGDGREYCTVLLVPNAELREAFADSAQPGDVLESPTLREMAAPLVSTVNRFLAPYERIVDFMLLSRDLDADRGELTAKGTPKRKLVAERFADAIEPMYSRERIQMQIGDVDVVVPNWVLRQTGISARELRAGDGALEVSSDGRRLEIERTEGGVRVGDLVYDPGGDELRLGEILGRAGLWLGNDAVREFAGPGIEHWWRRGRRFQVRTKLAARPPLPAEAAGPLRWGAQIELDLETLHAFARDFRRPDVAEKRTVVEVLRSALTGDTPDLEELVRGVLRTGLRDADIRAECLRALIPGFASGELDRLIGEHLADPSFLSDREIEVIARAPLRADQLDLLLARATRLVQLASPDSHRLERVLRLLVREAVEHPESHLRVRSFLAWLCDETDGHALPSVPPAALLDRLVEGFRRRLPAATLADGVTWDQALDFRSGVQSPHRAQIREALRDTPLLAEAIALLDPRGTQFQLEPLRANSLQISFLGTGAGRAVHLLQWSPEGDDDPAFECIVKVNGDQPWAELQRELRLLVRARSGASARPVVKTVGGGWPEQNLWTEEYVPGETLDRLVERLAREEFVPTDADDDRAVPAGSEGGRLPAVWPFVVSSCTSLIVDFWRRTDCRVTLSRPSPEKLVLPAHDWQVGGRLVSVADRTECTRLLDVLASVYAGIVAPLRARHPAVALEPEWSLMLSAAHEVLGPACLDLLDAECPGGVSPALLPAAERDALVAAANHFRSSVTRRGFLPARIRIAARRYRRWAQLNPEATLEARATTLAEIEDAYALDDLTAEHPDARLQLFRHTVFRGAAPALTQALDQIIDRVSSEATLTLRDEGWREKREADGPADAEPFDWREAVGDLRADVSLEPDEEFLLARLVYPHVDPRGRAVLTREEGLEGERATGVETEQLDAKGDPVRIRRPANPNETNALYRVFGASNFRQLEAPGQDLLVALDASGRVVGGVIFRRTSEKFCRLRWVVVSRHRRGRGIGHLLVRELISRLRAEGMEAVATGFFRPTFFAKFGFGVDPRYAGLVLQLHPERAEPAAP